MPKGNPIPAVARVWARSETRGECWVWLGSVGGNGYGQITEWVDGVQHKRIVHRLMYEHLVGPIPDGLTLDHLPMCLNKRCFRPTHLEPVTRGENARRGTYTSAYGQARRAATTCAAGHEYTEENMRVSKSGERQCRACDRRRQSEYRARRAGL